MGALDAPPTTRRGMGAVIRAAPVGLIRVTVHPSLLCHSLRSNHGRDLECGRYGSSLDGDLPGTRWATVRGSVPREAQ
jgi:hypothetical protein